MAARRSDPAQQGITNVGFKDCKEILDELLALADWKKL
jgi:hypothetical protein